MGFALVGFGLLLAIAGARNTQDDLFTLVAGDFTGKGSFLTWIAAIGVVGGVGYIPGLQPLSRAFLVLLFLSFIVGTVNKEIKSGGATLFQQFNAAISGAGANSAVVDNSNSGGVNFSDLGKALETYQTVTGQ